MITAGISDAKANKVWTGLRKKFGNNITEPYLRENMIQTKKSEHFTVEKVTIKDKNNVAVQRDFAYCHDI